MKYFFLSLTLIFISTEFVYSQKALTIGDVLPDAEVALVNYKSPTLKLSDLLGRYLLLDFWATWCSPCVAEIPKMDSLQQKFKDNLIILPVTNESKKTVQAFLDTRKRLNKANWYSVVGDIYLGKLFPHQEIPHFIWIDKNGVVKGITYAESVNSENLSAFVKDKPIQLPIKVDSQPMILPTSITNKPIQQNATDLLYSLGATRYSDLIGKDTSISSFHLLTKYYPGFGGRTSIGRKDMIVMENNSILGLFGICYGKEDMLKFFGGLGTRIVLITSDSARFTGHSGPNKNSSVHYHEWEKQPGHLFTYILKVPVTQSANRWEIMKQDLEENFPWLKVTVEKRKREVLILKSIENSVAFKSQSEGSPEISFNLNNIHLKNANMQTFMDLLKYNYQPQTILNETGYDGKIDMDVEANIRNLGEFNMALKAFGLSLQKGERDAEVLVFKDLTP